MMKRREFITLLGGAAVAWPLGARAQQARVPAIGWLGGGTPATQSQWAVAFTERLRQLGWSEGSSIAIEYRWAEGRPERFAEIAAEFVRLKVDVILAAGTEQHWQQKRRPRSFRSSSRGRATRLAPAWSHPWRDQAPT